MGWSWASTGMTLEPVVSSAMASMAWPSTPEFSMARRVANASAFMWSAWLWVAWSGSSFLRWRGYSPTPAPRRPLTESKIETRTLRVPKSTPATRLISFLDWRPRRVALPEHDVQYDKRGAD